MAEEEPAATGGEVHTELSRDMSLFDITFIGVGAMIGAGVFALTGFAAGIAGPALTLAFLINGFVALFTALSYAELGAAFPEAGGGYLWVKEALPDPNGFYAGWMSWFAHAVACSLYAITFGVFFTEFFVAYAGLDPHFVLYGFITRHMADVGLAVLVIALFAYINYRGAEETGKAGVVVTVIKVVILGLFIFFGIRATLSAPTWTDKFLANPSFMPNGVFGIIGAMGLTYIAFEGYEIIVQSGEEVVDPGKNIPKAVFYSLLIVVPIYVLVAFAAIGGINVTPDVLRVAGVEGTVADWSTWEILGELGELGIIRAADQFVPYGTALLLFAGLTATMSALNATVYSSSRVSFAMGRDRALPEQFRKVHQVRRTPHWAVLWSAVLIAVMAMILPIESVAASADIMFILLFTQVNVTLIQMRRTHPDLPRTYKVPFMPWPPLIGIGLQLLLTPFLVYELGMEALGIGHGNEGLAALVVTALWMLGGMILYLGYSEPREEAKREEEAPTVVTEKAPAGRENRILVPIANPANLDQLMARALDLAKDKDGELVIMSVVTVPQQTPLDEGRRFIGQERDILERALELAERAGVPASGTIRIGHRVDRAILNTVKDVQPQTLLMGWKGESRRRDVILGTTLDSVIADARCDVLVERVGVSRDRIERILLPVAGGPHAELAAEIAASLARVHDATIELARIVDPGADETEREGAREQLQAVQQLIEEAPRVEISVHEGGDVAEAIIRLTRTADLTILGATRESRLQQLLFGVIPETVGQRAHSPVLMARRHIGVTGAITAWFKGR